MKEFFDWRPIPKEENYFEFKESGSNTVSFEKNIQFMATKRYVQMDCVIVLKNVGRYNPSHPKKLERHLKADISIKISGGDQIIDTLEEIVYTNTEVQAFPDKVKNEVDTYIQTWKILDLMENI